MSEPGPAGGFASRRAGEEESLDVLPHSVPLAPLASPAPSGAGGFLIPRPPTGPPPVLAGGASSGAQTNPPFGTLRVQVQTGKAIARPLLEYMDHSYIRVKVGEQVKTTSIAREGGSRPRYGDDVYFDIRTERDVEIAMCARPPGSNAATDSSADMVLGSARESVFRWVPKGFAGDVELKDTTAQPIGAVTIVVTFERNAVIALPKAFESSADATSTRGGPTLTLLQNAAAKDAPPSLFSDEEIRDAFVSFDLDKNGFISGMEIRHILINIGETVTDEEVDEMVRMVDRDGDGQISPAEFYRMVSNGRDAPAAWLAALGVKPSVVRLSAGGAASGASAAAASDAASTTTTPGAPAKAVDSARLLQARGARKAALDALQAEYSFAPEALRDAWKRHRNLAGRSQFMLEYPALLETLHISQSPASDTLFQTFDFERQGKVHLGEILVGVFNAATTSKDDRLRFAFDVFDANDDGFLTKDDLVSVLKANHNAATIAEVQRKVELIIAQSESSRSGEMSFDEFAKVAKRFPNLMHPAAGNTTTAGK